MRVLPHDIDLIPYLVPPLFLIPLPFVGGVRVLERRFERFSGIVQPIAGFDDPSNFTKFALPDHLIV